MYSISAIAKLLDLPESTLHYWKNRFGQALPSVGQGRHKRFPADAVEVFKAIGALLESGMSLSDAKAELLRRYPPQAGPGEPLVVTPVPAAGYAGTGTMSGEEMAMRIGAAMAEAIGQRLQGYLAQTQPGHPVPPLQAALPEETVDALKAELARSQAEIEGLKKLGEDMTGKLKVLEAELIRLRKDGREMEKHLLGKIRNAGTK
nr:MerR family transcriptional regulator [Fundidesulfovibrio terrae]